MSDLYSSNSFARLGLRADADTKEVRRRIEELDVQAKLGASSFGLGADDLRQIRQQLESPSERLRAELFWLHSTALTRVPSTSDAPGLTAAIAQLVSSASVHGSRDRPLAIHDLAVLRHAQWLQGQTESVAPESLSELRLALADWAETLESPDFDSYLESRSVRLGTAKLDVAAVAATEIVNSIAGVIAFAIDHRKVHEAAALVEILFSSGLPSAAVTEGIAEGTRSLRGEVLRGLSAVAVASQTEAQADAKLCMKREALVNSVLGPFGRYRLIYPGSGDDVLSDRVALACRSVSIDVYNETQDAALVSAMLDLALETARSTSTTTQVAADGALVRYQHHAAAAVRAFDEGVFAIAAAHAELAEEVAASHEDQLQMSGLAAASRKRGLAPDVVAHTRSAISKPYDLAKEAFRRDVDAAVRYETISYVPLAKVELPSPTPVVSQKSSSGKWVLAAVVGALLLAVGVASANSGPSRSASATPVVTFPTAGRTAQPPPQTTSRGTSCSTQVRAMDGQLTQLKPDLTDLERQLDLMNNQIESLRRQIRDTEAVYPRGIPSSIYPSYSSSVDRLNALVADYNRRLATYKSRLADHNELVDRRNALARSC